MHLLSTLSLLLGATLPVVSAGGGQKRGLDYYAKKAGLKYFGAATDSPGQRERAGLEAAYPKYDAIMWGGEFGSTTPTNGQKVRWSYLISALASSNVRLLASCSGYSPSLVRVLSTLPRARL